MKQVKILIAILFIVGLGLVYDGTPLARITRSLGAELAMASAEGKVNVTKKGPWEQKWETTLALAKKEGQLTVYTSMAGEPIRKVLAAFTDKYGIKGEVLSARGPELIQRMQSERIGGIYSADAVMAGGTNLVILMKPLGFLDKIEDFLILPEVMDPKAWRTGDIPYYDKEHYGIAIIAAFTRYCLINTEMVKAGEITSYKDLLKPRWKGKIVMNDPSITGAGNAFMAGLAAGVWGVAETTEFLRQLVKQEPAISRDNRQLVEWVSRGKYEIGLAATAEEVSNFLKLGAPISLIKVAEGGKIGAMSGGIGIAAKRPHPNAAVVFVNWLLSKDGQDAFISNIGLPGARVDAPKKSIPAIFFPEPGEKYYRETEETLLLEGVMLKTAKEILAPLQK